jgi:RNA-directed DNA polymerase
MRPWSPVQFRQVAGDKKTPAEIIAHAISQGRRVQVLGVPAVLTLRHLAELSGVPYGSLRSFVSRRVAQPYRSFPMRKRRGGFRLICIPRNDLHQVQRWIALNILNKASPPGSFGAFAPGCSPVEVAKRHCSCRWLIKLDVQQFFESISERQVYKVFRQIGYEPLISFEMTRICTRVHSGPQNQRYLLPRWQDTFDRSILEYRAPNQRVGHLLQGAPSSPMLSNLVMATADARMNEMALRYGLVYSRYADDIVFSTSDPAFSRTAALVVLRRANRILVLTGFRPRTDKVIIAPPGARKVVLGMVVDDVQPRLSKHFKKALESDVYGIEKFGLVAHAESRGWSSAGALRDHIEGKLAFAETVDPLFARRMRVRVSFGSDAS